MSKLSTVTRRTFLLGSTAIAGGVAFGYRAYKTPYDNPLVDTLADDAVALTQYVRIDQSGITIIAPRAEMGQGVHTTLAALVAEELEVPLQSVRVEHGPASKAYFNDVILEEAVPFPQTDVGPMAEQLRGLTKVPAKLLGMQITGGSSSTPDAFVKMRRAGAAARHALIQAAALRLNVDAKTLTTTAGFVVSPAGEKLAYTELAVSAADIALPANPKLKPQSEWTLLGRSLPRVDMVAKSTGTAEYALDIAHKDMLYATVKMNPKLGGTLTSFDDSEARKLTGVLDIIELDGGIAVLATNTWYAFKGAKVVRCDWGDAPYPESSDAMLVEIENSFVEERQDSQLRNDGNVDEALDAATTVSAEYRVPFLAHATMEPMNATAWLRDNRIDIWAGNQIPTQVVKEAAAITGLSNDQIQVHTTLMGGGFGRRAEMDFIKQAITIAAARPGTPIKTTWSREEDMTHDYYRPAAIARFRGAVVDGQPTAFDLRLATLSVIASQMGRLGVPTGGPDASITQSAWDQPYAIPNYRVTGFRAPAMLPVSSWRSVGASQNGFFHESVMDELAHAANRDPLEMRLALMTHEPSRKVLEAVRDASGWGTPLPDNEGRGVAFVLSFGVPVAQVFHVAETPQGIKLLAVWAACDVGIALDPRNIEAQIQSGIIFGLSAAMTGEITIENGKVQQTNFHQYDGLRIRQAPPIHVQILEHGEKIRGIGEPGLPPVAPALGNAIFAATGKRLRSLPLNQHVKFA